MRPIACWTSAVGAASSMSPPRRWRMRARVLSSLPIGSWTPLMPRGPHSMPQTPIGVSNRVKCWSVMARSKIACPILCPRRYLGLEIVAIHPDSGNLAPEFLVMAGLVPAIHVFLSVTAEDVDALLKAGHDEIERPPASPHADPSRQRIRHGLSGHRPCKRAPAGLRPRVTQRFPHLGLRGRSVDDTASRDLRQPAALFSRSLGRQRRHLFDCAACRRPDRVHRETR